VNQNSLLPATNDILEKLKSKDEKAFELVFRMYYPDLCGFAIKYVQRQDLAEEMVQDVFYKLWEKLDSLVISSNLKSYLYTSVRNAAFNHFKHQEVVNAYEAASVAFQRDTSTAVDVLEVKELQTQIDSAINRLPERCREVFNLSRIEGKSYKEIAAQLEISVKTVENQMGKALKTLRVEFGTYLPLWLLIWLEFYECTVGVM
jgi:RNA polymerase sigma-70 factor (ECF subfamily)